MQSKTNNKTIIKNTIYLYIRMIFSMVVSLYTSRIVLDVLGVDDYGVYNVIGGLVVLIALINNSMSAATQRFITFELGKNDHKRVSDTFCMSMTIHLLVCVIILLLGETIGLYYVMNYLNVSPERHNAAMFVYQLSLVTVIANIVRVPYNATIIAHEKMNFFAIISVLEVTLQLLSVFVLSAVRFDKLIVYGFLVLFTTVICTITYKIYCQRTFDTCNYHYVMEKAYFKELLGYTGWTFVGTIATAGSKQIGNMMINYFCGPAVNAAYGIANRVNGTIAGFANNFQVAFTPQITKLYARQEMDLLFLLMNRTARLSYYLMFLLAIPLCFHIDYVLGVWLIDVPKYSGIFVIILIVYNMVDSLQAPLWKAISATGNIKVYEIWLNIILILNIPVSYVLLRSGYPPYFVVITSVTLNVVTAVIRTIHVKLQIGFPITKYIKEVLCQALCVSAIYICPMVYLQTLIKIQTIYSFVVFYVLSLLYIAISIYIFGINKVERKYIKHFIKNKLAWAK